MKPLDIHSARQATLMVLPFLLALAFWWIHPNIIIDADTPRYLANSPMRTATYPLFLDLAYGPALLPIQLFLFAAALSYLAVSWPKSAPWIIGAAIVLAAAGNPYVWQLQATVMAEALTIPLLTVIVSCIIGFCVAGRTTLIVVAAALGGVATTIRPTFLPFLLALLCAIWIAPRVNRRLRLSAIVVAAWLAPIVVERVYSRAVHGPELSSPIGRNLYMKAAVIDAPLTRYPSTEPLDRRLVDGLNKDFGKVRGLISRAPDRNVRYILTTNYQACAGYPCASSMFAQINSNEAELHSRMLAVAAQRIASSPLNYLELAVTDYHQLWLLHPRKHPALAPKYNDFLAREMPIPFGSELGDVGLPTPASEQSQLYRLNRAAFAGIGIVAALMTIGFLFWRPNAYARAALSLLIGTQAVLVVGAFLVNGQPRYVMGMWPALIAAEVLGLAALLLHLDHLRRHRTHGADPVGS